MKEEIFNDNEDDSEFTYKNQFMKKEKKFLVLYFHMIVTVINLYMKTI